MLHDLNDSRLFPKLTAAQIEETRPYGETVRLRDGELLMGEGEHYDFSVVVSGKLRVRKRIGNVNTLLAYHTAGHFMGEISLFTGGVALASAEAVGEVEIIRIGRKQFRQMIADCGTLGELILPALAMRSLQVNAQMNQDEKLAALGKMSAGLAHELNNPAAAAQRGATLIREEILRAPHRILDVDERYTTEQKEAMRRFAGRVGKWVETCPVVDPLERSDREQELLSWLEDRQIVRAEELTGTLAAGGATINDLEEWAQALGDRFPVALFWLETVMRLSELARDVESSTCRIADLVKAMKEYTYMDQARFQEIDVHAGLESTLKVLHHKLKKGITVQRDYTSEAPRICAYAGELNQVWTNLIDNAIDAMNGQGTLTVRTRAEEGGVAVQIIDTGAGIPEEVLPHIFEPFFTTKPAGKGTGLGLDITNRIVVFRHGGSIQVSSRPGQTTFTVSLPKNPPKESERIREHDGQEHAQEQSTLNPA